MSDGWDCCVCGHNNFASHVSCWSCGIGKPEDVPVEKLPKVVGELIRKLEHLEARVTCVEDNVEDLESRVDE